MTVSSLPRPLAFVLSGGATQGASQVGMLRALTEHRLRPDMVVGTSAGALNGALVAAHPNDAVERLDRVWRRLRRADIFPMTPWRVAEALLRHRDSLVSPENLSRLVTHTLGPVSFDDLPTPFKVVATDQLTGHPVVLDEGDVCQAVIASSSIPGVFPPVVRNGRHLVDGGLTANVPVVHAFAAGAASAIVLDASTPCHLSQPPRTVVESLVQAFGVLMREQAVTNAHAAGQLGPTVYLPTPCTTRSSPLDFSGTDDLIDDAYATAAAFLDDVLRQDIAMPGLYGHPHSHADSADEPTADLTVSTTNSG